MIGHLLKILANLSPVIRHYPFQMCYLRMAWHTGLPPHTVAQSMWVLISICLSVCLTLSVCAVCVCVCICVCVCESVRE
ncbi:unnamed protein product [Arctogadus glacialis]